MSAENIRFCRVLLKQVQPDVNKSALRTVNVFQEGSTYRIGGIKNDWWEFTFTAEVAQKVFRWEGEADNAYDARYKGFCAWLHSRNVKGY